MSKILTTQRKAAEAALLAALGTPDEPAARRELCATCAALAVKLGRKSAERSYLCGDDFDDLLGRAYVALCRAALAYDPRRGTSFSTLATRYIGMEMLQVASNRKRRAHRREVPFSVLSYRRFEGLVGDNTCRYSDTRVQAYHLQVPVEYDLVEELDRQDDIEEARTLLAKLPPRDAEVLLRRARGESLLEIASTWGVSKEAVRQRQVKALRNARKATGQEAAP